jgi:hypothetical protein
MILLLLFLLPNLPSADAQPQMRFGLNAGVNFGNQSFSPEYFGNSKSYRLGFVVGTLAEIGFSEFWSIQLEPRYIQKGMKETGIPVTIDDPNPVGYVDQTIALDYLEVPVLLKVKFGTSDFRPFAFAGPSIAFRLSARQNLEGYPINGPTDSDLGSLYQSIDASFEIGGGTEYQISTFTAMFGGVRYSMGLSNLSSSTIGTVRSYGFQILVGALVDF